MFYLSTESQKQKYKNRTFTLLGKRTKKITRKVLTLPNSFSSTIIEIFSYLYLIFNFFLSIFWQPIDAIFYFNTFL